MGTKKHSKHNHHKEKQHRLKILRLWILMSAIFLIIVIVLVLVMRPAKEEKVCFKYKCFSADIANTPQAREQGLMFRTQLDENRGMLFVFDKEDIYSFWMKNTLLPLDMIWINGSKQVSYIYANATSCADELCPSITPDAAAKYVLEINAGLVDFYSIKVGDNVTIE
jgi:uncharacterized membrane protein (UPF0127 family)